MTGLAGRAELVPDYRPRFPAGDLPGIAILGCGTIAKSAHLPAYAARGLPLVGVWSRSPGRVAGVRDRWPGVERVYASADLDRFTAVLAEADRRGVRVAVNHNGRWAPAWRLATLLVRDGAVGEVVGVTHLHDKPLPPLAGTPFDDVDHMLIADYLTHWVDITALWLGSPVAHVAAGDSRVPGQPDVARDPWSATVSLGCVNGATGLLRVVGDARARRGGCPFWIHGTEGTIRGSVLLGSDALVVERGEVTTHVALEGRWFPDGFAGTMGELMCALDEDRRPEHDAGAAMATVRITLAATASTRDGGVPVHLEGG